MAERFRTIVDPPRNPRPLSLSAPILSLGSCFAESIAEKLAANRFPICINPTGTLFNPLSIAQTLQRLLCGRRFERDEIFLHDGEWKSLSHHSRFSAPDADQCLDNINRGFDAAAATLDRLQAVLVTFGSAFVYRDRQSGAVVANCHRLPAERFSRELASIERITQACEPIFSELYSRHPRLNLILTVSPVRHLRDDAHENQVSKSTLMLAVEALRKRFDAIHYFPAYEIMMDELRDYRFYTDDMAHPTGLAVDYIWERFRESNLDAEAVAFVKGYAPILSARRHLIKTPGSAQTAGFARRQLELLADLQREFPAVTLAPDRDYFQSLQ